MGETFESSQRQEGNFTKLFLSYSIRKLYIIGTVKIKE